MLEFPIELSQASCFHVVPAGDASGRMRAEGAQVEECVCSVNGGVAFVRIPVSASLVRQICCKYWVHCIWNMYSWNIKDIDRKVIVHTVV